MKLIFVKHLFLFPSLFLLAISLSAFAKDVHYKKVNWIELMPEEDVKALYSPPEEIYDISESEESEISEEVFNALMKGTNSDYQRALTSTNVIKEMNNQNITIPGFIVPITLEGAKTTEFFIVPYFGACIHYPPPPPNQTIFAEFKKGFDLEKIYEPFSFSGKITISENENDIAKSAYHLKIDSIVIYEE